MARAIAIGIIHLVPRYEGVPIGSHRLVTILARLWETRVREHVFLISQEPHVFTGSPLEDLRLARAEVTRADAEQVLEVVGALDRVRAPDTSSGPPSPIGWWSWAGAASSKGHTRGTRHPRGPLRPPMATLIRGRRGEEVGTRRGWSVPPRQPHFGGGASAVASGV